MAYTPLDSDLLTSTLLKEGPVVVSAFVLILASRDRFGETSLQPATVASLLRIADDEADEAFRVLSSPDPLSRNRDSEGRRIIPIEDGRWRIVSSEKYQYRASKAAATERQRRHREKARQDPTIEARRELQVGPSVSPGLPAPSGRLSGRCSDSPDLDRGIPDVCDVQGCASEAEMAVDGQRLCSAHAAVPEDGGVV
jgi:hypothetical protein